MSAIRPERLPEAVIDAAIHWSIKLDYNRAGAGTRKAFEAWLQADPLHRQAWQRMGTLKDEFTRVPPQLALQTLQSREAGRRRTMKLLSAAGTAVALGWMVRAHAPWQRLLADASTATGEQRTLRLADGTVLVLNTDSAVGIEMAGDRRALVLRRGEILVTTGADAVSPTRRPFWVHTRFGTLQALGTRFVVRLDADRARISVQEGAVALHPAHAVDAAPAAVVRAGERQYLAADGTAAAAAPSFEDDAWADGVIVGRDIALGELLAELARYRVGRIDCDAQVAALRVSGVFHIKNTDQALQFLLQTMPIAVTYRTRFWVSVGPARAA
ncbi:FecR domain-containing protein [Variovorax sp. ZT4R33]|uniref:FecR domain-containing protein n=1 Tax=Variovorax sp. ZT4R33 TaxID=3443743 RepID=UPI003F47FA27